MKYGSPDVAFFLVGGRNLLGVTTEFTEEGEAVTEETTPLGVKFPTHAAVGVSKAALTQSGYFDDSAGLSNEAHSGKEATLQVVGYGVEGNVAGRRFVGLAGAYAAKYSRGPARNALHKANAQYVVTGTKEEGPILHALATETAPGNSQSSSVDRVAESDAVLVPIASSSVAAATVITTSVPHGLTDGDTVVIAGHTGSTPAVSGEYTATVTGPSTFTVPVNVTTGGTGGTVARAMSTNGGFGHLHVMALTLGGYDDLTVTLLHSVDNATFVTLGTFTVVTAAPAAERLAVAAATTVYRHLACAWAFTGAGADPSATFMVGFARG